MREAVGTLVREVGRHELQSAASHCTSQYHGRRHHQGQPERRHHQLREAAGTLVREVGLHELHPASSHGPPSAAEEAADALGTGTTRGSSTVRTTKEPNGAGSTVIHHTTIAGTTNHVKAYQSAGSFVRLNTRMAGTTTVSRKDATTGCGKPWEP